jgi:hypothetical protein
MPGSITHTYIAYLCFQKAESMKLFTSPLLSEIMVDHNKVLLTLARDGKASYKKFYDPTREDLVTLPSYAYLGCNGPDIFYMTSGKPDQNGKPAADILHYNKTGPNVIWALRNSKASSSRRTLDFTEKCRLAYWLGHISHIAADVIVHPFVNSIAAAYPDDYCDAEGNSRFEPFGGWAQDMDLFKVHNVVEHWQDAFILRRVMMPKPEPGNSAYNSLPFAGFQNWQSVNMCAAAANHITSDKKYFLLDNLRYYGYVDPTDFGSIGISKEKVSTFENDRFTIMMKSQNTPPDVDWYVKQVLPPGDQVDEHLQERPSNNFIQPQVAEQYILRAVDFTMRLWKEVDDYLTNTSIDVNSEDEYDMLESKKCFPYLRRHWNLDTGFSATISNEDAGADTEFEPRADIDSKNSAFEVQIPFFIKYEGHMEGGKIIGDVVY